MLIKSTANASSSILQFRRQTIEIRIEELIALLDLLDGDENLEPYLADTNPDRQDLEEDRCDFELSGDEDDTNFCDDDLYGEMLSWGQF